MKLAKSILMAALIAIPAVTFAQTPAQAAPKARFAERAVNQQRRIGQGVKAGELNRRQAVRLDRQQRSIHREARAMRAAHNGRLTARDRRILNHRQKVASHRIFRAKHMRRIG